MTVVGWIWLFGIRPRFFSGSPQRWGLTGFVFGEVPVRFREQRAGDGSVAFEFTKAGNLEAIQVADIASIAQSALSSAPAGTTFLLRADDEGTIHSNIVFPGGSPSVLSATAVSLSKAIAARSRRLESVPDLSGTGFVARLVVVPPVLSGAAQQTGRDFGSVVKVAVDMLHRNEWVAISTRPATAVETRRHLRWRNANAAVVTHQSLTRSPVIMSLWAGSYDPDRAAMFAQQVAVLLPGFDVNVRAVPVSPREGIGLPLGVAAIGAGVGIGLSMLVGGVDAAAQLLPAPGPAGVPWWLWGVVPSLLLAAMVVLRLRGVLPSLWSRVYEVLGRGHLPAPARPPVRWRAPRKSSMRQVRDVNGVVVGAEEVPAFPGDYPVARDAMLVGAHLPVALLPPSSSAKFGAAVTGDRMAAAVLRAPIGPVVVEDDAGFAHLSAADLWSGTFITGLAGSGKTYLMEALFGWFAMMRSPQFHRPIPGFPAQASMIAFDTKEDGAAARNYVAWADKFRVPVSVFNVASLTELNGIEFFPLPKPSGAGGDRWSAADYASEVVDALRYVFGDDSVGPRSRPSLLAAFEAGVLMHLVPQVLQDPDGRLPDGVAADASPFYYANILIGNRDALVARQIADRFFDAARIVATTLDASSSDADRKHAEALRPWSEQLLACRERLEPIYGPGVTDAQRRNLFDAPRSKVGPLLSLEHWWTRPGRQSWHSLLDSHTPVVLNFGRAEHTSGLSDDARVNASSLAMYSLYRAIKRTCVGWQDAGRMVALFADEVKHLAAQSADVLEWFRNDGRAFGTAPVFATQFPEQLPESLRKTMLGYGTRIVYSQADESVIQQVVRNISTDGSSREPADVATLARYTAIVKTTVDQTAQRAFTGRVPAFRSWSVKEFVSATWGEDVDVDSGDDSDHVVAKEVPASNEPAPAQTAAEVTVDVFAFAKARMAQQDEARRQQIIESVGVEPLDEAPAAPAPGVDVNTDSRSEPVAPSVSAWHEFVASQPPTREEPPQSNGRMPWDVDGGA